MAAKKSAGKPALKNTYTVVPADRTVADIQRILARRGARDVTTRFDGDGCPSAIRFSVLVGGAEHTFELPARVDKVAKKLAQQRPGIAFTAKAADARAVAWRNVLLWIEAQMAMVETEQVALDEVFLPYLITEDGSTLYQLAKGQGLLGLPAPQP